MRHSLRIEITALAEGAGAISWTLVRCSKHLIVDFKLEDRTVRQVMPSTPSDVRARRNMAAHLKRQAARRNAA